MAQPHQQELPDFPPFLGTTDEEKEWYSAASEWYHNEANTKDLPQQDLEDFASQISNLYRPFSMRRTRATGTPQAHPIAHLAQQDPRWIYYILLRIMFGDGWIHSDQDPIARVFRFNWKDVDWTLWKPNGQRHDQHRLVPYGKREGYIRVEDMEVDEEESHKKDEHLVKLPIITSATRQHQPILSSQPQAPPFLPLHGSRIPEPNANSSFRRMKRIRLSPEVESPSSTPASSVKAQTLPTTPGTRSHPQAFGFHLRPKAQSPALSANEPINTPSSTQTSATLSIHTSQAFPSQPLPAQTSPGSQNKGPTLSGRAPEAALTEVQPTRFTSLFLAPRDPLLCTDRNVSSSHNQAIGATMNKVRVAIHNPSPALDLHANNASNNPSQEHLPAENIAIEALRAKCVVLQRENTTLKEQIMEYHALQQENITLRQRMAKMKDFLLKKFDIEREEQREEKERLLMKSKVLEHKSKTFEAGVAMLEKWLGVEKDQQEAMECESDRAEA